MKSENRNVISSMDLFQFAMITDEFDYRRNFASNVMTWYL